jgi:hypothetical protein
MRTSSIIRTEYNTVEVTLDLGNNIILCSKIFDKLDNLKSIFIQAKNVVAVEMNFLQGKGLGVNLGIWDGKIQTIKKHTFHNLKSTYLNLNPINREFYLAKGTEKFILGRYLLLGILLILLTLRPWRVAARRATLVNRGAKSHFCDYFIIRARYLDLSHNVKYRARNSLHFLFFMFFCRINSFVVTACRNREFLLFLYFLFFSTPSQR